MSKGNENDKNDKNKQVIRTDWEQMRKTPDVFLGFQRSTF